MLLRHLLNDSLVSRFLSLRLLVKFEGLLFEFLLRLGLKTAYGFDVFSVYFVYGRRDHLALSILGDAHVVDQAGQAVVRGVLLPSCLSLALLAHQGHLLAVIFRVV